MKKFSIKSLVPILVAVILVAPFIAVPEYAVLISASTALALGLIMVFYQVSVVFFDDKHIDIPEKGLIGLPGEFEINPSVKKEKRKSKVIIDKSLPGVVNNSSISAPEFEIDDRAVATAPLFTQVSEVELMRNIMESIDFWDDLSFYKIKDSAVYSSQTARMIGEIYDCVFSGLATYFQRHKLTLDDLFEEDTIVKEYSEQLGSVVIGFVISLIEKEISETLQIPIDKTEVVIPKVKIKNSNLAKVVLSSEFKYQILLLIRKYYERQARG